MRRAFEAWTIKAPDAGRDERIATVVRFAGPAWYMTEPMIVSARPRRVTMGRFDRVMTVWPDAVEVYRGVNTWLAFSRVADAPAAAFMDRTSPFTQADIHAFFEI